MRRITEVDLVAVAVIVLAVWLLTNSLDSPNTQTWNVITAVVVGVLGLGALLLPRRV
jgi:hypothetical protein